MKLAISDSDSLVSYSSKQGTSDPAGRLADMQQALARAVHDVNNPLAIISGNAQLLLELARMMDLDSDLAKPISDIEEASRVLAERLESLSQLHEEASFASSVTGTLDRG